MFQPEIETLQSQIAQLHTQIATAQEGIIRLSEAESLLQGAVEKIGSLAPDAIAHLK